MKGMLVSMSVLVSGLSGVCPAQDAPVQDADQPGPSHIVFDEPEAVKCYLLAVEAAQQRAYAEVLDMDIPSAETQAMVLAAGLRVLNETPIDALPEEHQSFIKGLREIRNDITPRIVAAFCAVAAGSLDEEELTDALSPLEAEQYEREDALEAAHPLAAAAMGRENATVRALFISMAFVPPAEAPEVQNKGPVSSKERAARSRMLAEKIEEYLKGRCGAGKADL